MKYLAQRTAAYLIDCMLAYSVIMLVIQWGILSNFHETWRITNAWFEHSRNMQLYVLLTISMPVWLYFTYFDSRHAKGTIGKRIMKLTLQDDENDRISLSKSFIWTLLKLAPWEIAHAGVIFPTPIYYAEDPGVRLLSLVGILLLVSYFVSIVADLNNHSIYDKWLRTTVISKV